MRPFSAAIPETPITRAELSAALVEILAAVLLAGLVAGEADTPIGGGAMSELRISGLVPCSRTKRALPVSVRENMR
jgi:hypothetical protein